MEGRRLPERHRAPLFGLAGFLLSALWGSGACGDATGTQIPAPGITEVQVRLSVTDDLDPAIASAEVWISQIYLKRDDDEDDPLTSARTHLFNDPERPLIHDLSTLPSNLSVDLTGLISVGGGTYRQLRMMVDSARVTLGAGYRFDDGSTVASLKLPGASIVGAEVALDAPLATVANEAMVITVEFDLGESFIIEGRDDPDGFTGIDYEPVLQERFRGSSGT